MQDGTEGCCCDGQMVRTLDTDLVQTVNNAETVNAVETVSRVEIDKNVEKILSKGVRFRT